MEDKVIIVSCDSHAGVPKELWPEYLPKQFHDLLPQLREDNEIYPMAIYLHRRQGRRRERSRSPSTQPRTATTGTACYDPVLRLADMDREGIAAELIYLGDSRLGDMFHNVTGRDYGLERVGGRRARAGTAGRPTRSASPPTASSSPAPSVRASTWTPRSPSSTGSPTTTSSASTAPATCSHAEHAAAVRRLLGPVLGHVRGAQPRHRRARRLRHRAGHGVPAAREDVRRRRRRRRGAKTSTRCSQHADAVLRRVDAVLLRLPQQERRLAPADVADDARRRVRPPPRPASSMLTEIRLDWIPATLAAPRRGLRGAPRRRSRRSASRASTGRRNCLAGASFIHKVEVEMRHEIGVDTILFGRDFPHPEGTWPHTQEWLRGRVRAACPRTRCALMLGENAHPLLRARPGAPGRHRQAHRPDDRRDHRWRAQSDRSCSTTSRCAAASSSRARATSGSPRSTRCSPTTCTLCARRRLITRRRREARPRVTICVGGGTELLQPSSGHLNHPDDA